MKDEKPVRLNSTLLDSRVCDALRKYATVATQQGRTDRATLALELLSKFDAKAHANVVAQHKKSDVELIAALQTYHEAVQSQNRADRIQWASQTFVAFHADAIAELHDEFAARFSELDAKISALAPTGKKR